jgi:hypothetical protein
MLDVVCVQEPLVIAAGKPASVIPGSQGPT